MPLFPRLHQVIRVDEPVWENGEWVVPADPAPEGLPLDVQPKDDRLIAFGDVQNPIREGDILLYDYIGEGVMHSRWVCVQARKRDMLGPDTAHVRYEFRAEQAPGG